MSKPLFVNIPCMKLDNKFDVSQKYGNSIPFIDKSKDIYHETLAEMLNHGGIASGDNVFTDRSMQDIDDRCYLEIMLDKIKGRVQDMFGNSKRIEKLETHLRALEQAVYDPYGLQEDVRQQNKYISSVNKRIHLIADKLGYKFDIKPEHKEPECITIEKIKRGK